MHRIEQMKMVHQMAILRLMAGPMSYLYISQGLKLKVSLPMGGGRKGSMLGSSRADPTLLVSANAIVVISIRMRTCPLSSSSPVVLFLEIIGSQKLSPSSCHSKPFSPSFFMYFSQQTLSILSGLLQSWQSSKAFLRSINALPIMSLLLKKSLSKA